MIKTPQLVFSPGYKRYALAGMTAVLTLNFVDRTLMTLMLQPIKQDLNLSDTQLGFVTGIAFGLFYAAVGIPIARWADRGDRVTVTALAIGLWGLTVMGCLFVSNYIQLVVARIAAAIGEAGCKPPTYSLVGDYFPEPAERTRAMAIYLTGGPLSALLGFLLGGWLNELYGWRVTFFLMGVPGLILAIVVKLSIIEPRKRVGLERPAAGPSNSIPFDTVLSILWRQRSFRHLCSALIIIYTVHLGVTQWIAAFLMRSHGMSTVELGLWLGFTSSVGGALGVVIGGVVVSRWFTRNERGQMRLIAINAAALVPCFVVFLMLPGKYEALAVYFLLVSMLYAYMGPTYALMQRLVADEMRATMMAVVMMLANLIGIGVGPQIVGVLSDLLQPALGVDSLRYAMAIVSFVALWAAYHFWRVGRTVEEDLLQRQQERCPSSALSSTVA